MDLGTLILIVAGVVVVLVVLDLLLAGGAMTMTMGTMHGMALMASHPAGWAILLVLLAILGVLVYAVFFR